MANELPWKRAIPGKAQAQASGPKVPCSVQTFQTSTARPGARSLSQPGAVKGQEELRHLSGTLNMGGWGAGEAMATAAEPADGSEGSKPGKKRPETTRSGKSRLAAEAMEKRPRAPRPEPAVTGDGSQNLRRPRARARGCKHRAPRSRSLRGANLRGPVRGAILWPQRGQYPGPGGGAGEPGAALARPRPYPPGPDSRPCRLTCVAHGSGVHCA